MKKCPLLALFALTVAVVAKGTDSSPTITFPSSAHGAAAVDRILTVSGPDGSTTVNITPGSDKDLILTVKNTSTPGKRITLTHISCGSPVLFVPLPTPVVLSPGSSTTVSVFVDRHVSVPAPALVMFRFMEGEESGFSVTPITLSATNIYLTNPGTLFWAQGDPVSSKASEILQTPPGSKVLGVRVIGDGFAAKLNGASIVVTPTDLNNPADAFVQLVTEPATPQPVNVRVVVTPARPRPAIGLHLPK
jgi:hypothetical protein